MLIHSNIRNIGLINTIVYFLINNQNDVVSFQAMFLIKLRNAKKQVLYHNAFHSTSVTTNKRKSTCVVKREHG